MNKELEGKDVSGVSEIAGIDGAEAEVLKYRGAEIPEAAAALYKKYVEGVKEDVKK